MLNASTSNPFTQNTYVTTPIGSIMKKRPGSAVPYGPPIHEAVAQGDISVHEKLI
ncbi:hypothetical protein HF908_23040 (plasmid) [Ralstonia pseudosolanacearum]|uniref:hypothetical protein n=1 Tax=Ralstonia pseudosolanacearum TaxID=1310165 RepID=UPI00186807F9|nr:hypothetical protein [Ralstonia pseudosolanacearum]QOK94279.1 hypothetical protein HF908_23040 [Ralstonia pseudosolanacearum]